MYLYVYMWGKSANIFLCDLYFQVAIVNNVEEVNMLVLYYSVSNSVLYTIVIYMYIVYHI